MVGFFLIKTRYKLDYTYCYVYLHVTRTQISYMYHGGLANGRSRYLKETVRDVLLPECDKAAI